MYLGQYLQSDTLYVPAVTHKFETGFKIDSSLTGYIIKINEGISSSVNITFNKYNSETGLYVAEIDLSTYELGAYMAVIKATIDTIDVIDKCIFRVVGASALYGSGLYGEGLY